MAFHVLAKLLAGTVARAPFLVPVVGVSLAGTGALVGSYDLSYRAAALACGVREPVEGRAKWTGRAFGAVGAGAFIAARELLFLPPRQPDAAPPSKLSFLNSMHAGTHYLKTFPYQFRLISVMAGGAIAGAVAAFTVSRYQANLEGKSFKQRIAEAKQRQTYKVPTTVAPLPERAEDTRAGMYTSPPADVNPDDEEEGS